MLVLRYDLDFAPLDSPLRFGPSKQSVISQLEPLYNKHHLVECSSQTYFHYPDIGSRGYSQLRSKRYENPAARTCPASGLRRICGVQEATSHRTHRPSRSWPRSYDQGGQGNCQLTRAIRCIVCAFCQKVVICIH